MSQENNIVRSLGETISIVRVPGYPRQEDVQRFTQESGVTLIAAIKIFSGIPTSEAPTNQVDGTEFIFSGPVALFSQLLGHGAKIYVGFDKTDHYKSSPSEKTHPRLPTAELKD